MTHGDDARARANTCRTAFSLSPTYLFSSSGPLTLIKLARLSFATALASSVLPQPGGPQRSTPHDAVTPRARNSSGRRIGCTTAMLSSSRVWCSAPMSSHVTSGTVAKPSRLDDGCTTPSASRKSWFVMASFSRTADGRGSGNRCKNVAIDVSRTVAGSVAKNVGIGTACDSRSGDGGTSAVASASASPIAAEAVISASEALGSSDTSPTDMAVGCGSAVLRLASSVCMLAASASSHCMASTVSLSCSVWKIRFTAMMPAAAVSDVRSAPTKPGVRFARYAKSKSPARRSFWHSTCRILI